MAALLISIPQMKNYRIKFLPSGKTVDVEPGSTVMAAANSLGLRIDAICVGRGTCGKCGVQVESSAGMPEPTEDDIRLLTPAQIESGIRLACRCKVEFDLTVTLPRVIDTGKAKEIMINSADVEEVTWNWRKALVALDTPSLDNLVVPLEQALVKAMLPGAGSQFLGLDKLKYFYSLSTKITDSGKNEITIVTENGRFAGAEEGDTTGELFGAAVDIGTTTVALYLCNLATGQTVSSAAATNVQVHYGDDVVNRIGYCVNEKDGLEKLSGLIRGQLAGLAESACEKAGVFSERIYRWILVGNSTMQHLFLGLDPSRLGFTPFMPLSRAAVEFSPAEFGLGTSEFGSGVFLPLIAGHVGADMVAVALSEELDTRKGVTISVDLGTNGEIILADNGKLYCCSTAAGPALEGACISSGMRAVEGAVDRFEIGDDLGVSMRVIGRGTPLGICGTGLLEVLRELRRTGVVDSTGRILPSDELPEIIRAKLGSRLRPFENGQFSFAVAVAEDGADNEVLITQADIRQLQLACGAISCGIGLLLDIAGKTSADVDRVLLAGAFGTYLRGSAATGSGIIRDIPVEKIVAVGNAAGHGARLALFSDRQLLRAARIAERVQYVELAKHPAWQEAFSDSMMLP